MIYDLVTAPAAMTVDPNTGVLDWTPAAGEAGNHTVVVRATDGEGAASSQAFLLTVRATNAPPVVAPATPDLAWVDASWSFTLQATDPDGDPITYALSTAPAGMTLGTTSGELAWTPTGADLGSHAVDVLVSDPFGGTALAMLTVEVVVDGTAPDVSITFSNPICVNRANQACVIATDDDRVDSTTLTIGGVSASPDAIGCALYTPTAEGPLAIEATATDSSGNVGLASESAIVLDCDNAALPQVALFTPEPGARIGEPVSITGAATPVSGFALTTWTVSLYPAGADPLSATVLNSGTGPLPAVLGQFDPTALENGGWVVRLEVSDTSTAVGIAEAPVVVDGGAKLGSFDLAFLDAEWTTPINATSLVRSYSTTRKDVVGDFGHGWRLSMTDVTVQTNGALGEGSWVQQTCAGGFGGFSLLCLVDPNPHLAVVKWPNGRIDAFDFTPEGGSSFLPITGSAAYTARTGTFATLEPAEGDTGLVIPGDGRLYHDLSLTQLYDPQQFWLTDVDGTRFLIDKHEGLREIVDRFGNKTVFTPDGIFPDVGTPVVFVRDGLDRIEQMQLPDGSDIDYVYDAAGDLVEVIDGEQQSTDFVYDGAHRLTRYNLAGEPPLATIVYGPDGRVESVTDDSGVLTNETTDLGAFVQTTVGPDPRLTTTRTYDADGMMTEMVSSYVDEAGVQQDLVETWTYDTAFLASSHTLATGAVETWTYDADGRVASHTDPAGVQREWVYGPFGQVAQVYEGGELAETTTFDAADLPFEVTRADGTLLRRMSYDSQGLPLSFENGTGQTMTIAYDANHQIDSLVLPDFAGNPDVVDVVMDGRGQLLEVTRNYPDGPGTTAYAYDANGNRTSITDPRGQVMSFTYDTLGRMLSYTDKLSHAPVVYTYDQNGRELTKTNRNGEVLTRTYDSAGRLHTLTGTGVDKEFEYDALGRPVMSRNGTHVETRVYDGPFLVEVTVDGVVDHTWDTVYDGAGRLVQLDGDGQSVTYGYDSRGRLGTVVEDALGTFSYGYDVAGRMATLTRPSGAVTRTLYTDAGQTRGTVTEDALGALVHQVLTSYDDRGLPDAQTDDEGNHDYEHDVAGRLTGVDHPVGAAFDDEAYTYDQADRRTSSHDDPLAEVVYDNGDRLVQDAEYVYAYDDEGRRTSRTHRVTGEVTTYTYSVLDQMVSLTEGGVTWTYAYDARDLRVLVANDAGYGEAFVYDEAGLVRGTYDAVSGARTASYVTGFGFGEVLARVDGVGVASEALRDRLGSTVGWLDPASGAVLERIVRDAYGVRSGLPSVVVPYGYTGHAEDPTGLVWGRARYLATCSGGWTSADPIETEARYGYANQDPSSWTDFDGLSTGTEYELTFSKSSGGVIQVETHTVKARIAHRFIKMMEDMGWVLRNKKLLPPT